MAYKLPTKRRAQKEESRLNLIPILDAVFIFIFFLLMSAQFIKIYEIASDVPIVSSSPPPKDNKKPLALTLQVTNGGFKLLTGVPARQRNYIKKTSDGAYDFVSLHDYLINLKKKHMSEKTIILEPQINLSYEEIVKIMDAVRMFKNTDEAIYKKDKDGLDVKVKELFSKIIFGNLLS
jgi:biopolymer transport protein ExbD